jgi:hypothetical protein
VFVNPCVEDTNVGCVVAERVLGVGSGEIVDAVGSFVVERYETFIVCPAEGDDFALVPLKYGMAG